MKRLPLYYFNVIHTDHEAGAKTRLTEAQTQSVWTEIENSIDSLQHVPKKMYCDRLFTYNNALIVIPPADVPKALDELYMMPEGHNKRLLLKLAAMGTSLVPCEERELFMAWRNNETEFMRKEEAGETITAEEIGSQSVRLLTRNKVIGQVIFQTLAEGEAGILFLGHLHNLMGMMTEKYLKDILGLNVIEMNPHVRETLQ
jgi:hypothetical protein